MGGARGGQGGVISPPPFASLKGKLYASPIEGEESEKATSFLNPGLT